MRKSIIYQQVDDLAEILVSKCGTIYATGYLTGLIQMLVTELDLTEKQRDDMSRLITKCAQLRIQEVAQEGNG